MGFRDWQSSGPSTHRAYQRCNLRYLLTRWSDRLRKLGPNHSRMDFKFTTQMAETFPADHCYPPFTTPGLFCGQNLTRGLSPCCFRLPFSRPLPLRSINPGRAHIYLEYGPQTFMGNKDFYTSNSFPAVLGKSTSLVHPKWFYIILGPSGWETGEQGSHNPQTTAQ